MKLMITFVSPKNPTGKPIDVVSQYQSALEKSIKCLLKEIIFRLSEVPCNVATIPKKCDPSFRNGFSFVSTSDSAVRIIDEAKATELLVDGGSSFRMVPVFVAAEDGKKIVGFFGQATSGGEMFDELSQEYAGRAHRDAFLFELNALMSGYTMIEPRKYQEESYNEDSSCGSDGSSQPIAVNDDDSANISEAIDERNDIWRRYISRHSMIKETKARDTQLTNTEVSLDLNNFCRYGRHVEDLTSR
jgi:hypothetical protein